MPNRLQRQFNTSTPNTARVTDITYIRTHGFNNQLSPVEYEVRYEERLGSVWKIGGDSF